VKRLAAFWPTHALLPVGNGPRIEWRRRPDC
jgi:hypothetical protein